MTLLFINTTQGTLPVVQERESCVCSSLESETIVKPLDISRDRRKSPKTTILAISQLIKSTTYIHYNLRFRVFRQSPNKSVLLNH
jgi:hypothetical protein